LITSKVSKRYAKALVDLSKTQSKLGEVGEELSKVSELLEKEETLRYIFFNPAIAPGQKSLALKELSERLRLSPLTANFLNLLLRKGRFQNLPDITEQYRIFWDEILNRATAEVQSTMELSEEMKIRLREKLSQVTGKQIILKTSTNPELLGGIVTKIGSMVFDGSVRTQLERMKEKLVKG
jgi:F-type H+-transporting ATPase subunit delta